jgi:hypothetical protein
MDEPDGVYGVASIRQAQPTVMEEILAHESLGKDFIPSPLRVWVRIDVHENQGKD